MKYQKFLVRWLEDRDVIVYAKNENEAKNTR